MRAKLRRNTADEDAAINRGIAQDPDNPEVTEAFFANARPATEVLPDLLELFKKPANTSGLRR